MDGPLTGRVALVTGGGKGIGAHYVRALAESGAKVAAADVDQAAAVATAARLSSEGAELLGVPVDVTDEASVERAVASAVERFGRLDILVNNAALYSVLMPKRKFWEESADAWDQVLAVNLKGSFLCAKAPSPTCANPGTAASSISRRVRCSAAAPVSCTT